MTEKIKELIDKRFSKIKEYINSTSLMIHHTYISSMSFFWYNISKGLH